MHLPHTADDLSREFATLLTAAMDIHASEIQVALDGDQAPVTANIRGERLKVAEWPADRCPAMLKAAYGLCDGAGEDFAYGKSYSLRMTGERFRLPPGVTMILMQFLPPRDGARHLVARVSREADVCCGTCGG